MRTTLPRKFTNMPNLKIFDTFNIKNQQICNQYNKIYMRRLQKLRPRLAARAETRFGTRTIPTTELKTGECAYVVGILYKHMRLAHTALKEIEQKLRMESAQYLENYSADDDKIFVDDEYLRIELLNFPMVHEVVSGIIIAVKGVYTKTGQIIVEDVVFPEMPPFLSSYQILPKNDKNVLFLSGLNIGQNQNHLSSLNILIDILTQIIEPDSNPILSDVSHVIISGGIFQIEPPKTPSYSRRRGGEDESNLVSSSERLDKLIHQLTFKIPVILMPGNKDPCSHFIPQQPFHRCFFPESSRSNNFFLTTNPLRCLVGEYEILGTSGQNIRSISEYSRLSDPIDIAKFCLSTNLLFPNAPENIGCYQFSEEDPFVIESTPRIFFFGSATENINELVKDHSNGEFLILGIPSFSKSRMGVKVNLDTLELISVTF